MLLKPMKLTQKQLADHIGRDIKAIDRIINEKTSVTAETALKLGAAFNTSAGFWLNAQKAMDLYEAGRKMKKLPGATFKTAS